MKTNYHCNNCQKNFVSNMSICYFCHSTDVNEIQPERKASRSTARSAASSSSTGWVTSSGIQTAAEGSTELNVGHLVLPAVYAPLTTTRGLPAHHMVLFYGDAGVGKSSVAMRLCDDLLTCNPYCRVLYISSEEHVTKLRSKSKRFCSDVNLDRMDLLTSYSIEDDNLSPDILGKYGLVVVDSISAFQNTDKEVSEYFRQVTWQNETSVLVIGHVNKEGEHAGHKTLSHIVDAIWEGLGHEGYGGMRTIVAGKNREQATGMIFYELTDAGAKLYLDEGDQYLKERQAGGEQPGSILTALAVGGRPVLVDVQVAFADVEGMGLSIASADVDARRIRTVFALAYRFIQRSGVLAVMLRGPDVGLVNGSDINLPLAVSMVSSAHGVSIPKDVAVVGDLDISGRIYAPIGLEDRLNRLLRYASTIYGPDIKGMQGRAGYKPVHHLGDILDAISHGQINSSPRKKQKRYEDDPANEAFQD